VFLINSRLGLVTATPEGAPLLPKLRGHFAEFLRESYLALLGILYLPTCVGLGYRCKLFMGSTSFSWKYDISEIAPSLRTFFILPLNASNALPGNQHPGHLAFSVPRYQTIYSTGMLTCWPSDTPFGLSLGPDSPSMDEPTEGTLRFSEHWILTNVCVTQADILTSASSTDHSWSASP
jgi:hypothetical protein